ncbi:MAG: DUF883 family protein [Vicinamibacteria bacterium]
MSYDITSDKINDSFKSAISDAEDLVKATAAMGDENITRLRAKAEASLRTAKGKLADTQDAIRAKAQDAATALDAHVHEKPWESIGMAAAGGLAIGLLAGIFIARDSSKIL